MILFNDPLPCPHSNERAVRMSLEIRDQVADDESAIAVNKWGRRA
jgi:hypothetical protein